MPRYWHVFLLAASCMVMGLSFLDLRRPAASATNSQQSPLGAPETELQRAAASRDPVLRTAPSRPRQGHSVFVWAGGLPAGATVTMSWDGKRYPIYRLGSEWRGVVPLQIEEKVGQHRLRVAYASRGSARRVLQRTITVGRTPLRVQKLKMARRTEKLYSHPGRAKELATIRRALRKQTPAQHWDGNFRMPAKGRQSTPFGVKRIRNGRAVGYHRGLDIAAPTGTPIHAAAAGKVVLAQSFPMHGKTVVIDHGLGVTSLYIHQSAIRCRAGQMVRRGDRIGDIGMTGTATGPHLHWSIYVHGTAVSPLFWTRLPA